MVRRTEATISGADLDGLRTAAEEGLPTGILDRMLFYAEISTRFKQTWSNACAIKPGTQSLVSDRNERGYAQCAAMKSRTTLAKASP